MSKSRLEAFSDCVLSIIITVMVLNLHVPTGADLAALAPVAPLFFCYVVSFVFVGTYWNNHHHLLHAVRRISGAVLWANLHLLFWLSLLPFVTAWMGTNHFAPLPTALYAFDLLMSGVAYTILSHALIAADGKESLLAQAVGSARKERMTLVIYALAIPIAFWNRWVSQAIFVVAGLIWLIPDRRIESRLAGNSH
ncbi:MAG TPA: TMEM175 family protein [Terracidiphilus sp.]|nr:TMEM175 family protein [Terracidiphilus sp.]